MIPFVFGITSLFRKIPDFHIDVSSSWVWNLGPKTLGLFVKFQIFRSVVHFVFLTSVEKQKQGCYINF